MELRPEIDDPVQLHGDGDRSFESRVVDLGQGLVVVARPRDLPDDAYPAGTDLSVSWADADHVVRVLPTRIFAIHTHGALDVWSLLVTGPAQTKQRRRYDRVAASGPVKLRPAADEKARPVDGTITDVSEGAVRCVVGAGAADQFLMGPSEVVAEFRLGTVDFAVPGRVEFLRATKHPAQFEDLVVVFDEPVAEVDALREQIAVQEQAIESASEVEADA